MDPLSPRTARPLAALLLVATTSGCYTTWEFTPKELGKLHAYKAPASVRLVDNDAVPFTFDPRTELRFYQGPDRDRDLAARGRFTSIDVVGGAFVGIPENKPGPVRLDLNRLTMIEARRLSTGLTTGLVLGSVAGAALLALGIVLAAQSTR